MNNSDPETITASLLVLGWLGVRGVIFICNVFQIRPLPENGWPNLSVLLAKKAASDPASYLSNSNIPFPSPAPQWSSC